MPAFFHSPRPFFCLLPLPYFVSSHPNMAKGQVLDILGYSLHLGHRDPPMAGCCVPGIVRLALGSHSVCVWRGRGRSMQCWVQLRKHVGKRKFLGLRFNASQPGAQVSHFSSVWVFSSPTAALSLAALSGGSCCISERYTPSTMPPVWGGNNKDGCADHIGATENSQALGLGREGAGGERANLGCISLNMVPVPPVSICLGSLFKMQPSGWAPSHP
jgi:hypothetical protein